MKIVKFASEVRINDGVITAVLSSEREDRDGDVIRASGWQLDDFMKAPRLLSCHVYDDLLKHIGKWENVRVRDDRLVGEPIYFTDSGNQEAIYGDYLARRGEATYSVGFEPLEAQPRKGVRGRGTEYLKQALLETSHVPVPSNADALTLMAKAIEAQTTAIKTGRKWSSAFMTDDDGFNAGEHCIVPGCDDASQLTVPICAEHLKVLMNADAEPPGGEADEQAEMMLRMLRGYGVRMLKAGKPISGSNMSKVHTALDALHGLHDAGNCTDSDCAYGGGDDGAAKAHRALGEGAGATGGALVDAAKPAFEGAACPFCTGPADAKESSCTCETDCGKSKCPAAASKGASGSEDKEATTQGHDPAALAKSLNDAMDAALEGVAW